MNSWNKENLVKLFEMIIENNIGLHSHPSFRKLLDRDRNLFVNQVTREANNNLAYNSVDFDIDNLPDEEFWKMVDSSRYQEILKDNAATDIFKMAKKLRLTA